VAGIKAVARKMPIMAIIGFSERHVGLLPNFAVPEVGVANCVLRVSISFTA